MKSYRMRRKAFEQIHQNYLRELLQLVKVCEAEADWELAVACYQKIFLWESDELFAATEVQNSIIPGNKQQHSLKYLNLAQKLQQQQKLDLAIEAYQKAIAIKPQQPAWVYQSLGNLYQQLSQPEAAITTYQKAIAIEPQPAWVYQSLGNLYQKQQQLDLALAAYQQAIAIEPQPAWVYQSLGNLYQKQEQLGLAIEAYQKAIAIEPQPAWMYCKVGQILEQQGQTEAAIEAYQQAIAIEPQQSAELYQSLGNLLQQQQQLDAAITMYRQAIEINPAIAANVYVKIGDILQRQHKPLEAQAAYELAATELSNHNCDRILAFLRQYFPQDGNLFHLDLFDNGCEPTGRQLCLLADNIRGRVVGTNIGKDFPEKTVCDRRENTEFYWMDGQKLTFSDNSFDAVVSLNVLEHVPNPQLYLQECYRVMRLGGFGYFSWYPIWSGATGHHMHPGMMSKRAKNLGIIPPEDYDLDGKTIPFWGHLLLDEAQMLSLLIEEKKYSVALAEWMVHYIYQRKDINRWFWQDFLNVFHTLPWQTINIDYHRQLIPQQVLKELQTKYGKNNDFRVKGATIIVYKD